MNQNLAGLFGFLSFGAGVALPFAAYAKDGFDLLPLMLAGLCWVTAYALLRYAMKRPEKS